MCTKNKSVYEAKLSYITASVAVYRKERIFNSILCVGTESRQRFVNQICCIFISLIYFAQNCPFHF